MPEKIKQPKQPVIEADYSPEYRRIVASGIWGIVTPIGLDTTILSEQVMVDDIAKSRSLDKGNLRVKRTVEFSMIIPPTQMKAIYSWLGTKIDEYEHIFGNVPKDSEINERAKSLFNMKKKQPSTS